MKKIYFVRHGESEYNQQKKYSGTIDTKLTQLGIHQAQKTGDLLKDKNISYILSSDLSRAYDTASEIKKVIDNEQQIVIESTPILREVFFGDIQDKAYIPNIRGLEYAIESGTGESAAELYTRANQALDIITSIETKGNLLVVGHGSFTAVIFAVYEGKKHQDDLISYRKQWNFKNAEIKQLDI